VARRPETTLRIGLVAALPDLKHLDETAGSGLGKPVRDRDLPEVCGELGVEAEVLLVLDLTGVLEFPQLTAKHAHRA
jgi:hypothetical protein